MDETDRLERLTTSLTELRPCPPRHRQSQLRALHTSLVSAESSLSAAIASDSPRNTPAEVEAEYLQSVETVRHFYDGINVAAEAEQEYAIVKGKDAGKRRVGVGMVVVRPGGWGHTRLFGIIAAVAAAVAGGNCVILELPPSDRAVDKVLSEILTGAMDINTFWVSPAEITSPEILARAVLVDQAGPGPATTLTNQIFSSSQARVVAVVDRTADIEAAARAVTTARFAFGGGSPYAPDLVLVHEFVKQKFLEACSRFVIGASAERKRDVAGEEEKNTRQAIQEAADRGEAVNFGSDDCKLVDVLDRNSPITTLKITGCFLPIASCSSLVDAVSFQPPETTLLAGYFFANPPSAKYLSQFLPAHTSFTNHIPPSRLLGPAAALAHDFPGLSLSSSPSLFPCPYTTESFTRARPQFVVPPPPTTKPKERRRKAALGPLRPTGQPKTLEGLDHFAGALFLGGGLVLAVVVPLVGWTSYVAGKAAVGYFSSRLRR
ncbi:hypothetical protein QBC47DRAFT_384714 [Echria macrotheca]|uniref:Aldehyde dehydrogenase domain-containing protein n=1 Tax=Echria macrotheca TaxID=438768 RepID=A0AAJ0BF44_9PEZI|nr:hypothetical protein QBC47DRAFT_384714 [Echria macrotheca]